MQLCIRGCDPTARHGRGGCDGPPCRCASPHMNVHRATVSLMWASAPFPLVLVRHVHGCEVIWWMLETVERLYASHRNVHYVLAVYTHEGTMRHAGRCGSGHLQVPAERAGAGGRAVEQHVIVGLQTAMFRLAVRPTLLCIFVCGFVANTHTDLHFLQHVVDVHVHYVCTSSGYNKSRVGSTWTCDCKVFYVKCMQSEQPRRCADDCSFRLRLLCAASSGE